MFYKNNYRPAFAGVGTSSGTSHRAVSENGITFNSADSETEDFNSFGSSQGRPENKKKAPQRRKKKKSFEITPKMLLIGVAALLAVVFLVIGVVAVAKRGSGDLKAKNNSFASYELDGKYYVAMNGEVIGSGFENEIELTPAVDNSFAYVIENTAEGYNIFLLERKELTL